MGEDVVAWFKENFVGLLALIIAVGGLVAPLMTAVIDRNTARSDRFAHAIEHLKNESLAVRMGALFELKKLGLDSSRYQVDIIRILSSYVREQIPNSKYWIFPKDDEPKDWVPWPDDGLYLATEILSHFFNPKKKERLEFEKSTALHASLLFLDAKNLYIGHMAFQGANLYQADFRNAKLHHTDFRGANLHFADCRGANFFDARLTGTLLCDANLRGAVFPLAQLNGADLRGAYNLTAEQLLEAIVDDTTLLDPDLRAEYDRLKAEQE